MTFETGVPAQRLYVDKPIGKVVDMVTPRQYEILRLLAKGYRYREIGERLNVSKKTVEHQAQAMVERMDASTITEVVAMAAREGLS